MLQGRWVVVLTLSLLSLGGCRASAGDAGRVAARADDGAPSARRVSFRPEQVDSLVPREEALARFQAATPRVSRLAGGEPSRDRLVRSFVHALEGRDTVALRQLLLSRSEFAYLYYPTAPQGLPPYDLNPELLWFMLTEGSAKGLGRALAERGGPRLGYLGYSCDPQASREGENTVWGPCAVQRRGPQGPMAERLFGLILERDGRYKFVSYANKL